MKLRLLAGGLATVLVSVLFVGAPAPASAAQATCTRPASNAEALGVMHFYAGYMSAGSNESNNGNTRVSVFIKGHPSMTDESLATIQQAIGVWNDVLTDCLDGAVMFTAAPSAQDADVVLHYVPRAGGQAWIGVALCLPYGCQVTVRSEFTDRQVLTQTEILDVVLHELGHVLGLDHATNLVESYDLMGYGWLRDGERGLLSQCDVDALASIWSWAIEGTEPTPGAGPYDCQP